MNLIAAKAREAHEASLALSSQARNKREERDSLIRTLLENNWSYSLISRFVGISVSAVAKIARTVV